MAQITTKSGPFKVENNAQTLPKQLQNNCEKVQKMTFFSPKMVKYWPLKTAKLGKILTENLDFRGHLSIVRAENTSKSRHFKVENNAQTLP